MIVCGIDPGSSTGAVAFVGDVQEVFDLPQISYTQGGKEKVMTDFIRLRDLIQRYNPDICVIERVWGRPGDGPAEAFRFGYGAAICKAAMQQSCDDVREVLPGTWKKAAMIFRHLKHESLNEAREMFPSLTGKLKRKKDVDRADALLIAKYLLDEVILS